MSLDGYIAGPGDDLDFLSIADAEGEDYGYGEFYKTVDTIIMGRKTFEWVYNKIGATPHPDKLTYVPTRNAKPDIGKTVFYTGNLKELVLRLKKEKGKNIYCDGGAEIVHELLKNKLIDEFIISIVPVLIGGGKKLFKEDQPWQKLKLSSVRNFKSGLVQLHYKTSDM
jgi:dihydrofolate reductase